ncbi:hypothetical protein NPIL_404381, partial [Nephila pilipes]
MSSSDEDIPKFERPCAKREPRPCEPLDLSIRVTRDASSHSGGSSISSLPVSEGSPSDRRPVGPSALPGPVSHANQSSNSCNQELIQSHLQTKQPANKQFPCSVYNKVFTEKSSVQTRMRTHTGEKPYTCEIRGRSFFQKGKLESYIKSHTINKPFTCDTCGRKFSWKPNLKTHIDSVHKKEKSFSCKQCG